MNAVTTDLDEETPDKPKRLALHHRILIGLAVGVIAGITVNHFLGGENPKVVWVIDNVTQPIGQLFLRLLLMIVVPLVFSSLVVGVAGIGDIRKLGRVGLKSFGYCLVISGISVVIGITLANTIKPGKRIDPVTSAALQQRYATDATRQVEDAKKTSEQTQKPLMAVVETIVPKNPFYAVAGKEDPNMLHVMFFALVTGIAITLIPVSVTGPLLRVLEGIYEVTAKIIEMIMKFAPFAVACLLFNTRALWAGSTSGSRMVCRNGTTRTLLHMFGVYSLSVYFLSRISPFEFFKRIRTVILTAFSTSSSNATLPTALRVSEQNLGVPQEINSFVLTVGATANQNGTALYEGVTVLFLAQLAGVDLSLGQQVMVVFLAILGGVGTAGVPSGSIPFIIGVLVTIGVNPALIAIILGVDRILDMCRTTLNVAGDITAATFVARSEGYELLRPHEPAIVHAGVVMDRAIE